MRAVPAVVRARVLRRRRARREPLHVWPWCGDVPALSGRSGAMPVPAAAVHLGAAWADCGAAAARPAAPARDALHILAYHCVHSLPAAVVLDCPRVGVASQPVGVHDDRAGE